MRYASVVESPCARRHHSLTPTKGLTVRQRVSSALSAVWCCRTPCCSLMLYAQLTRRSQTPLAHELDRTRRELKRYVHGIHPAQCEADSKAIAMRPSNLIIPLHSLARLGTHAEEDVGDGPSVRFRT